MVHFSFATLTTLGSDDLRPASSAAQALAVFEAILGVLIVALLIARLVAAATTRQRRRARI
jgi:hypothetical protein